MPETESVGSGSGSRRSAGHTRRLSLGCILLLLLSEGASGGERGNAAIRPGETVRSGCVVRLAEPEASGVSEATADCHWPIHPERVIEIVVDQGAFDEVLSTVSESAVLPDGRVIQVHSMGRAVADRQVTLRFRTVALDDGGIRVDFRQAREQERLREGMVQVELNQGWWEIRPDGAGGTLVHYSLRYDPGGSLLPWIVRRFQKSGVARSMQEIRRAAEGAAKRVSTPPIASGPRDPQPNADTP